MIQTNAESLLNYVNSILELSRLESGKIQYEDEECDIIQLCSEVLDKVNGREESTVSVSLQTDLKEQFARTDRRWFDTLLVSMLTPSENDTARYEAIIRIRRDRTRSALYFDVVNAPFAKVHFENKTSLIRHEINAHFIHYFGGIYKVQTEAEEGLLFRSLFLVEIDADDAAVGRQCVEGFFGFKDSGIELCAD